MELLFYRDAWGDVDRRFNESKKNGVLQVIHKIVHLQNYLVTLVNLKLLDSGRKLNIALASIGGWTWARYLQAVLSTPVNRTV
jgi:hypothetical protein